MFVVLEETRNIFNGTSIGTTFLQHLHLTIFIMNISEKVKDCDTSIKSGITISC